MCVQCVLMYWEGVRLSGWLMPEFWTGPAYNLPCALLLPRSLGLRHVHDNASMFKQGTSYSDTASFQLQDTAIT
jgi:hypothetical protein